MKRSVLRTFAAIFCVLAFPAGRWADEGMWLLDSVNKLPLASMKKYGLELTSDQIYNPHGTSLKDAILLLGGGTASFISPDGLILTNHHIAFGSIQALSSVQDDYLKNGFWAKNRNEERSTSVTAQIVREIRDVTPQILSAVNDTMTAEARSKAIQSRIQEVEKNARGTTDFSCRVSDTYNGLKYYLYVYEPINDIRLVYAPPSSIGNFGGEVDNWIWPRHTGDFSIMRAYVAPSGKAATFSADNVPYKPKVFLPISTHGFSEGSFAMIMGFPGRTFRYREAAAVQLASEETLPTTIGMYKTRIDVINTAGKTDRAIQIKYASKVRSIANTYKNYLGVLDGMNRANLIALKRADEQAFAAYINEHPDLAAKYGTVLNDLDKSNADMRTVNRRTIFMSSLSAGVDIYRVANRFNAYAKLFTTDSAGQTVPPPDKETAALKELITSTFKNFDLTVDKNLFGALLLKGADLPVEQQPASVHDLFGELTGTRREEAVRDYVDELYSDTRLSTPEGCLKLIDDGVKAIHDDAFVRIVTKIEEEQAPIAAKVAAITATLNALRHKYVEAWLQWKKGTLTYPDANRSIRLTYGQVKSFSPRDGVLYKYETTLGGVIEKERAEDPFTVPDRLKELWQKKDFGQYVDPRAGDVPVAFIADLDITGGNSGSPVINGKGELIGCAFDGNWESVVGDYYFQESLNRTISVDARYVLFILDKFSGAKNILQELVVR